MFIIAMFLFSAGCYYEVHDARSGQVYYTDRWVAADGYTGPLTITDATGREVRIQDAHVVRLNKQDYFEAVEAAHDRETTDPPTMTPARPK